MFSSSSSLYIHTHFFKKPSVSSPKTTQRKKNKKPLDKSEVSKMRNKNGKRARVEPPTRTAESVVVANRRIGGGSSPSNTSSSASSCLSTTEEMKEEVASSWVEESPAMVVAGCRRCFMYVLVLQEHRRCPKCKCTDLIQI